MPMPDTDDDYMVDVRDYTVFLDLITQPSTAIVEINSVTDSLELRGLIKWLREPTRNDILKHSIRGAGKTSIGGAET